MLVQGPVSHRRTATEFYDDGAFLGAKNLRLTHDDDRRKNHEHPALWLHWGDELSDRLQKNDRAGWYVSIERLDPTATYPFRLSITKLPPT